MTSPQVFSLWVVDTYCHAIILFQFSGDREICISTDGLGSFISPFGVCKNEEAKRIFFNTNTCPEKYQNIPLKRLYNIVTKGKCVDIINEPILNGDDFTMIKIKCNAITDNTEI